MSPILDFPLYNLLWFTKHTFPLSFLNNKKKFFISTHPKYKLSSLARYQEIWLGLKIALTEIRVKTSGWKGKLYSVTKFIFWVKKYCVMKTRNLHLNGTLTLRFGPPIPIHIKSMKRKRTINHHLKENACYNSHEINSGFYNIKFSSFWLHTCMCSSKFLVKNADSVVRLLI